MKNIYLNTLLVVISLSVIGCNTQKMVNSSFNCDESIYVTYDTLDGDYNSIELPKSIKDKYNWVTVEFHQDLKDSIDIYIDDKHFEKKGSSISNVFYKYDKDKRGARLFIKNLTNESCLEFLLDSKYNLAVISKVDNQWRLEYSGYYEILWKD
jgi:hypothetical protein